MSKKNVPHIFNDLKRILTSDESAFFMSAKGDKVLVQKGSNTVYSFINNDEKECLTAFIDDCEWSWDSCTSYGGIFLRENTVTCCIYNSSV